MGNRIAKMVYSDGPDETIGYCVYQSSSEACFWPIFHNELAAHLFARGMDVTFPRWSDRDQEAMADAANKFMRETFGEDPEKHDDYWEALAVKNLPICANFLIWLGKKPSEAVKV